MDQDYTSSRSNKEEEDYEKLLERLERKLLRLPEEENNCVAIGYNNVAVGCNSIAIGYNNIVHKENDK